MTASRPVRTLRWARALAWLAGLAAAGWCAAITALWAGQERLLFHPLPLAAGEVLAHGGDVHERSVEVPGARLSVLELRLPHPKGVVYFLHGNAGNLKEWFVNTDTYRQAGYDLVMLDYRGFGKSTGQIESEAQLHADVRAVWREVVAPRAAGIHVVIQGRSLGTGLAAALAADVQPDLLVLVSPYRSLVALAGEHYPWVPGALLRYPLRTDEMLQRVRGRLLLIHGDRDTLIPPAHSAALQATAPRARWVTIPGAAHGDVHRFPLYRATLLDALAALAALD